MADTAFRNTSDKIFVDGDLVIRPGETVKGISEDRANQFRGQYGWQFEEVDGGKDAKSESEVREASRANPVAPINDQPHVAVTVEDGTPTVEEPTAQADTNDKKK